MARKRRNQIQKTKKGKNGTIGRPTDLQMSNQANVGTLVSPVSKRIVGEDVFSNVFTGTAVTAEEINPCVMNDTARFVGMTMMYARNYIRSMTITYVPTLPITTPGTLHMAIALLGRHGVPSDANSISVYEGAIACKVTQQASVTFKQSKIEGVPILPWFDFWDNKVGAMNTLGVLYGAVGTGLANGTVAGTLYLHYDMLAACPRPLFTNVANTTTIVEWVTDGVMNGLHTTIDTSTTGKVEQCDDGHSGVTHSNNWVFTGKLGPNVAGFTFTDALGKVLTLGARIFWHLITAEYDGTNIANVASSSFIGRASVHPDFSPVHTLLVTATGVLTQLFTDVIRYGPA
jgi:hypothetical protein